LTDRESQTDNINSLPIGAVAYYGPDNLTATHVLVAIIDKNHHILKSAKWNVEEEDIRQNEDINHAVAQFLALYKLSKVIITEGILGCPHEPNVDYPAGEDCPYCPYWANQ
jgi:hypothetical protein